MELTIDQAMQQGINAHKLARLDLAERFYRAILEKQPLHPEANHKLGLLFLDQRDALNALSSFENALKANPTIQKYWVDYIRALIQGKKYERALSALKTGKALGLPASTLGALKVNLNASRGVMRVCENSNARKKGSLTHRRKVLGRKREKNKTREKSQKDIGLFQEEAQVLLNSFQIKNFKQAERLARVITKKWPDDPFAWKILGAVFGETGRIDEAFNVNAQVVKLAPNDAEAHYNLGLTMKILGRFAQAETSLKKAITFNPLFAEAFYNLGNVLKELERLGEAETAYIKAIELKPGYYEAHFNLGNTLRELGRLEAAETSYLEATKWKGGCADAHYNFAATAQKLGKLEEASKGYSRAISIRPNYPEAINNLGTIFREYGRFSDAELYYKRALELKPDFPEARYNLGLLLIGVGDFEEAKRLLVDNSNENSQTLLLKCYFELEDKLSFSKQLDFLVQQGALNSTLGALTSRAKIRFGIKKENIFSKIPFEHVVTRKLSENHDFHEVFVRPIRDILKGRKISFRTQDLLIKGQQTAGNLFAKNNENINRIETIILEEIENYRSRFHGSDEGFLKNWPSEIYLKGWLINMKSGGELKPHMHENGWLSGAVYINVPDKRETNEGNFVVCVDEDLYIEDRNSDSNKTIDVSTGDLVIFPSSLSHYTVPFSSSEERTVLAFDVRPR
ncbi:tetratricopeptide repeat protein [Gammaproteobacteria bacterium]|nr:tetratricopeptide repeat protein [Gammaproteobacteria bacterium]